MTCMTNTPGRQRRAADHCSFLLALPEALKRGGSRPCRHGECDYRVVFDPFEVWLEAFEVLLRFNAWLCAFGVLLRHVVWL